MSNTIGQMQISFSMIFSIILIITFIAFAIYGIGKFLSAARFANIESFKDKFQEDINSIWDSQSVSDTLDYSIPRDIEKVCFINDETENMYFIPNNYQGDLIENIDMEKTLASSNNNPKTLCIETLKGKTYIKINKEINDKNGVTILE